MVNLQDVMDDVRRLSMEIYNNLEVVAGSLEELREIERLRGIVESYLGTKTKLIETPLISWRFKSILLDPKPKALAVAPYVESGSVKSRWFKVEGNPIKLESWRGFPEGYVAIVEEPANPDDINVATLNAVEAGASALIVESRSAPRKIVTNGYWGYNFNVGAPTPIPVVIVEEGYSSQLDPKQFISIEVEATTVESTGYTLTVDLEGSSEDIIMVGAHHDRWYGGFLDDVIGIAQAMVTAKRLWREGLTTRLLIFTAEEHGAPGYASWYWAWGSRFYASQIQESNLSEAMRLFINYDMAAVEPLRVSGSPQYTGLMEGMQDRCCECPECDSFSLATIGIPTLCIHSLWSSEVRSLYHTPMDEPSKANFEIASKAVESTVRSVLKGPSWGYFENLLIKTLGEGGLEARRILYVVASLAKRVGWDKVYRSLARIALKAVHYGSYRFDEAELEATWFPEVTMYLRLLKDINLGRAPHEVIVVGEERTLYVTRGFRGRTLRVSELSAQYKANMRRLWSEIEEIQRELLR